MMDDGEQSLRAVGRTRLGPTSLATGGRALSTFGTGVDLAGTSTGDILWDDGDVARGACELGEGRGSSTGREGMGGDGEEYAGMLRVVGEQSGKMKCYGITGQGEFRKRKKLYRGD
jgi:hypothetical protein